MAMCHSQLAIWVSHASVNLLQQSTALYTYPTLLSAVARAAMDLQC